jgi:hypothetical protein
MDVSYDERHPPSISSRREYLLSELRCGVLRARLAACDLEAIGLAVKGGLINCEQALEVLHDCDALRFVGPPREEALAMTARRRLPVTTENVGYDGWSSPGRREAAKEYHEQRAGQVLTLVGDDISLERAYAEINDPRKCPTPRSTIDAVMYCVRERGLVALHEPQNQQRLVTFDVAACRQLNERIAKLETAGSLPGREKIDA